MKTVFFILSFVCLLSAEAFAGRVDIEPIVFYDFTVTVGTEIADKGAGLPKLDLEITESGKMEWLNPGLRVKESALVKTNSDRTKLDQAVFFSEGIMVEAWLKPLNNTQSGPARIITFSDDSGNRNFTLGQSGAFYDMRFRTSENPKNGNYPSTKTPGGSIGVEPVLQHVVYTRDKTGNAKFYIDGALVGTESIPGDGSNWGVSYGFGLANETNFPTDDRAWLGDIFLVAIYGAALSSDEIAQNFNAGIPGAIGTYAITLAWDANMEEDLAGYKIYYGEMSRYDPALRAGLPAIIKTECEFPTEGDPSEANKECYESWIDYCLCVEWEGECLKVPDPPDPMCDSDYFSYDNQVDVENVLEYTIRGLVKDREYYFAATAYDTEFPKRNHESKFSVELMSAMDKPAPSITNPKNVRIIWRE